MSDCDWRVNLFEGDTALLACPICGGALRFDGRYGAPREKGGRPLRSGALRCLKNEHVWSMIGGIPSLVERGTVTGRDRLLRPIYDFIAPSHDLGVEIMLPLLQFPDPGASRDRYVRPMDLASLAGTKGTIRILEVGIGAGANLPLLRRHLPAGVDVEMWGVDLSAGMLLQCALRAELLYGEPRLRLLMADAHKLPFADATFDRVFHVGGINGYRDVARGLAEMARVAKPGTPIVVVDEELDPKRWHSPLHRLAFESLTWFDRDPRAPVDAVPKGAVDIEVSRVSRFYYCLRFRMPGAGWAGAGPAAPGSDGASASPVDPMRAQREALAEEKRQRRASRLSHPERQARARKVHEARITAAKRQRDAAAPKPRRRTEKKSVPARTRKTTRPRDN
jgi:SAM-dependent methyltransferase/uncharacterized protein YbaR (Trm112 family)